MIAMMPLTMPMLLRFASSLQNSVTVEQNKHEGRLKAWTL